MEMALNMGAFEALDSLEIFAVDGGDKARQERVDALRASGQSIGSTTKAAVNTQATVTGWALALVGVAVANLWRQLRLKLSTSRGFAGRCLRWACKSVK